MMSLETFFFLFLVCFVKALMVFVTFFSDEILFTSLVFCAQIDDEKLG